MAPKRKRERGLEELDEFDLDTLSDSLRRKGGPDLAALAILDLARSAGLTLKDLKKAKETLPAFASAWENVAPKFGLDPSNDTDQLDTFSVPHAFLPPSFHKNVMTASTQWLDVYQERGAQRREAARVRLMDAWHVPVCALFKGRIVDLPEKPETSGGEVEHEIYMVEGIILLVVELKLEFKNERDHTAQVLLELAAAYKQNRTRDFEPQPPVYAVLTDLRLFKFYRYDGSEFTLANDIYVISRSRKQFLDGMGDVTERLFSVILQGYISTLRAIQNRSIKRGHISDPSEHNSAMPGKPTPAESCGTRDSLDNWTKALLKAEEAQKRLVKCDRSSSEAWEKAGQAGLRLLEDSVLLLPKIGSKTDWDPQKLEGEIAKVMERRRTKSYAEDELQVFD